MILYFCSGFEKTVVKLLTEVTLGMKSLQKNVEQNTSLLMELISRGSAATAEIDAIDLELPTELPLKAVNDLEALDAAAAEDPALAKKLVGVQSDLHMSALSSPAFKGDPAVQLFPTSIY